MLYNAISICMLLLLIIATYKDIRYKEINDYILIPFCLLSFISSFLNKHYYSFAIGLLIFIIVLIIEENSKIGGADLLLYSAFISYFSLIKLPQILMFPALIALLLYLIETKLIKKHYLSTDNGIAFIPGMFLSIPFIMFIAMPF